MNGNPDFLQRHGYSRMGATERHIGSFRAMVGVVNY